VSLTRDYALLLFDSYYWRYKNKTKTGSSTHVIRHRVHSVPARHSLAEDRPAHSLRNLADVRYLLSYFSTVILSNRTLFNGHIFLFG
jgi:hypothetical protein